jgi:hypothetical protein
MNRAIYFDFIQSKLTALASDLEARGRLNILNLNLHSEDFYLHLCNLIFGWELQNLNSVNQNAPAIDLVDKKNKIAVQVSSTATKRKIESALTKDLSAYSGYSFKFISISKDVGKLRSKTFRNPHSLTFDPTTDIFDIISLLKKINGLEIEPFKAVYDFIKKELKTEPDPLKMDSNLTTIIEILSKENWNQSSSSYQSVPFEIENKIEFNQLDKAKTLIEDYKIHYYRIDKIYTDFDKQGANKSLSILNGIRDEYLAIQGSSTPDQCFFLIIKNVSQKVITSANFKAMPIEELDLCAGILVVDAFVRCKIFKNPIENNHAHP